MKSFLTLAMRYTAVLGQLSFLFVGCSKEPLDGPCQRDQHSVDVVAAKHLSTTNSTSTETANGAERPGTSVDGDNDGSSISDDGDDISDGERNRKKRPN